MVHWRQELAFNLVWGVWGRWATRGYPELEPAGTERPMAGNISAFSVSQMGRNSFSLPSATRIIRGNSLSFLCTNTACHQRYFTEAVVCLLYPI
jgi:hypothetical protein